MVAECTSDFRGTVVALAGALLVACGGDGGRTASALPR
jgi:hypothetical protein